MKVNENTSDTKSPKQALKKKRSEILLEFSERLAHVLKDMPESDKIGDLLYDEKTGLPK